jgi:hypothetical protein
MTEPTNTDKARYVAERLGLCWHEYDLDRDYYVCSCGFFTKYGEAAIPHMKVNINPTFLDPAGRIQLLELMMGRDDWDLFCSQIGYRYTNGGNYNPIHGYVSCYQEFVNIDYLTEDGLLLDAAWRFLKEKEGV